MPWLQTFNSSGRGDSSSFDERPLPFEELGPVGSSFVASDPGDVVDLRLNLNQVFCVGFVRCFSMVCSPSQIFHTPFELLWFEAANCFKPRAQWFSSFQWSRGPFLDRRKRSRLLKLWDTRCVCLEESGFGTRGRWI